MPTISTLHAYRKCGHQQRLAGASLLVFANKQDIHGSMNDVGISQASRKRPLGIFNELIYPGARFGFNHNTSLEDMAMQRIDRAQSSPRFGLGSRRRCYQAVLQHYDDLTRAIPRMNSIPYFRT